MYFFVSLKLEDLSERSGGWQREAAAAINTIITCSGLTPSDCNAFNGLAQISVHMLGFACWVKWFRFYDWPLKQQLSHKMY